MPDIAVKTPANPSVSEVIRRAVADPKFAKKLKRDAEAALKAGNNLQSPQMLALAGHFYADPQAIAKLHPKGSNDPALAKTWLTTTTITSPECLSTTTTTTTLW